MFILKYPTVIRLSLLLVIIYTVLLVGVAQASAATMRITPSTGVYTTGSTFTVSVLVDSASQPINAAEGTISFNPQEVSVVSVSRASSIFNLWVTEPTFSNSAGTINFSGGSPGGYNGSGGAVMTVTMRAVSAGSPRLNFANGAVFANDGKGTNVLTGMSGGTFTIQAQSVTPVAEQIVEYVPALNTPGTPVVTSQTHPDQTKWYNVNSAQLSWKVPDGITAVRTLVDTRPTSIPTKVYDTPISTITLSDLPEGESYFHLQMKNEDGWGKVAHYRIAVDTKRPESFEISLPTEIATDTPQQKLVLKVLDSTSKVERYMVQIDGAEAYEYLDVEQTGMITLPVLTPGYHTVVIEAFDKAGNSLVSSFSFTTSAFNAPKFTEYPAEINDQVIPVLRGETKPGSVVEITVRKIGSEPLKYSVPSDEVGIFTFIPEGKFSFGVYEISAQATDSFGAQSDVSAPIRIAVQEPGYIRFGSYLVNVLSVVLSLLALTAGAALGGGLLIRYVRRLRKKVIVESREVAVILQREFDTLFNVLKEHESHLMSARRGGTVTKAEAEMIAAIHAALGEAQNRIAKEVADVDTVAQGGDVVSKK